MPGGRFFLLEWREYRALTQADVASAVGRNRSTVSKWETGESEPALSSLEKLAQLYGVEILHLLAPPLDAGKVRLRDELQRINDGMADEDRGHWLAIGKSLGRKGKIP